jgi:RHS repeat-associated protein
MGWYKAGSTSTSTYSSASGILSGLLTALSGGLVGAGSKGSISELSSSTGVLGAPMTDFLNDPTRPNSSTVPKAYLNWVVLDEAQFKLVADNYGAVQMPEMLYTDEAKILQANAGNDITIGKNGYLYVYLSNESMGRVYFDKIRVEHTAGAMGEVTHYYPFGLTMQGISSRAAGEIQNKYLYNGKEMQSNEFSDGSGLELYDYGARMYDQQIGRWGTDDPKASKFSSYSSYAYCFNNPIILTDPDGQEPIKPLAGTVASFISIFNNTPSKIGLTTGAQSGQALLRLGSTEFSWKQMRPLPITTPYFNNRNGRYIYTENGGWIDMVHFLFYAGKGYQYKQQRENAQKAVDAFNIDPKALSSGAGQGMGEVYRMANQDPVGEAVQDGYKQEMSDRFAAKYSAYSYEDLPTDKFAADFGANYFDPKSKLTLGEQIQNYLNNNLKATTPDKAPNYKALPTTEPTGKPKRTNHTTIPVYTKDHL